MNLFPLVSVGIPVYNEEKFILKTVKSVLNQDYPNIEIIISDNNSDDNTYDIFSKFDFGKRRIKIFKQISNIGPIANFEFVLKNAVGSYFMWLGGHDYIHPNYISKAIDIHKIYPNVSLVYFNHQFVDCQYNHISTPFLPSIDSGELSRINRSILVYRNLNYCTHIHGIWNISLRKELIFNNTVGVDHLILFIMSLKGPIKSIEDKYYFRLVSREDESWNEVLQRYDSYGFKIDKLDYKYPIFENHMNYLYSKKYYFEFLSLGFNDKRRFWKYLKSFI